MSPIINFRFFGFGSTLQDGPFPPNQIMVESMIRGSEPTVWEEARHRSR